MFGVEGALRVGVLEQKLRVMKENFSRIYYTIDFLNLNI